MAYPLRSALLALLAVTGIAQAQVIDPADRPEVKPIHPSKIVLVGDSTTAVHGGWGPSFCASHVTSFLTCTNLARGGRSTYNYRAEGSWDVALNEMRTEGYDHTWVLIQFGHNDQPGNPDRSTDLATEFSPNLKRYVEQVRATGAIPVLVTPLTRRQFTDGKLEDDLGPWAAAVRKVAKEMDVPLIDLHARSRALIQGMGPVLATRTAQHPPESTQITSAQGGNTADKTPAQKAPRPDKAGPSMLRGVQVEQMAQLNPSYDNTHLGPEGAVLFAAIMADELAQQVPEIRPLLIP